MMLQSSKLVDFTSWRNTTSILSLYKTILKLTTYELVSSSLWHSNKREITSFKEWSILQRVEVIPYRDISQRRGTLAWRKGRYFLEELATISNNQYYMRLVQRKRGGSSLSLVGLNLPTLINVYTLVLNNETYRRRWHRSSPLRIPKVRLQNHVLDEKKDPRGFLLLFPYATPCFELPPKLCVTKLPKLCESSFEFIFNLFLLNFPLNSFSFNVTF